MPRWLIWTLVALVSWGFWAVLLTPIGKKLSPAHSQALSTIGLLPVAAALIGSRRLSASGSAGRGALLAFAAGALTCAGNVFYYRALQMGENAAAVIALTAIYPLVTVILAIVLLREKLNKVQLAGIILSLAAIYVFNVQKEEGLLSSWLLQALLPVILWGVSALLQKLSTNQVSGELSALWFLAAFVPAAGIIFWLEGLPPRLEHETWILVLALGFTFGFGNYALLAAFARNGKASIIAPISGLYPLVSIPIVVRVFGKSIERREVIGIVLALAAVVSLSIETRPAKFPAPLDAADAQDKGRN
jgi:drug/metabolite transporter (DMT)-like permease